MASTFPPANAAPAEHAWPEMSPEEEEELRLDFAQAEKDAQNGVPGLRRRRAPALPTRRLMRVVLQPAVARQIQRERTWLHNHRGAERTDAFEAELRHALDLLVECPKMGDPSPRSESERHWFLLKSRFHVFYRLFPESGAIRVVRIRHERPR